MSIGKPDPVVFDLESGDFRQTAVEVGLAGTLYARQDLAVISLELINGLNSVDNQLNDGGVESSS